MASTTMFPSVLLSCLLYLAHIHLSHSAPVIPPNLLECALFQILPPEEQREVASHQIGQGRQRRSLLDHAFLDPIRNLTNIDEVVEPFFNLSAAEKDFFRLPTSEFHDRIYNQFEKIQRRVFNESLAGMEAEFSRLNTSDLKAENEVRSFHEKRPGYERREKTYRIPSKDGVRIVRKGLKKYKDSMQNWVEHTFVHKPKSVVFEEKSKLENATSKGSANASIPLDRLKAFWGFERDFDNLMRKYEKDMTNRVFHHYDRVFDNFLGHRGDFLDVPKSLADIERLMWEDEEEFQRRDKASTAGKKPEK
ncbi:hypothetical protein M8J76_014216 [Diaphorina citri]|nr:hypothetical protein M8J76_014216 [Diaphorina citri]